MNPKTKRNPKGAGRPALPPGQCKVSVCVQLSPWLAVWSVNQVKSRADLIEEALINHYGLNVPNPEETK